MRKQILKTLSLLCVLCLLPCGALAVTLTVTSSFAGSDASATTYAELLREYEELTGNTVEDRSAPSDEAWKAGVLNDFAAGNEPDVLFFFANSADSAPLLQRVVPVSEINAAYRELDLPESESLREENGLVYAVPVRPYWEGLFVNTDLFERYGIPLPDTWEHFIQAIQCFREAGIVPIAVSLSDIPHYLAEFAMLACCTEEEYICRPESAEEVPEGWLKAMELIRELYRTGSFQEDTLATSETASSNLFREKKAAMQIDGSWFCESIPTSSAESVRVFPVPSVSGNEKKVIGGTSMGFYLTKKAWNNPKRRDAAVELLSYLTRPENARRLDYPENETLLSRSAWEITKDADALLSPLQDSMNKDAREIWLLTCIPAVAAGSMTPAECWELVFSFSPFAK